MTPAVPEDVLSRYRAAKTHRERAEIEMEAWAFYGAQYRKNLVPREKFLSEAFGVSLKQARLHLGIWNANDWASPLWDLIEKGMSMYTATDLIAKTKKSREQGETLKVAFERTLLEYKESGDGRRNNRPPAPKPREPAKGSERKTRGVEGEESGKAREAAFREKIQTIVRDYVNERMPGFLEVEKAHQIEWFNGEIKTLCSQFSVRVRNRAERHADYQPSRRKFLEACQVLRLPPPKVVTKQWKLGKARSRFKEMARQYHPDMTRGNTAEQFQAVMRAWEIIESFGEEGAET